MASVCYVSAADYARYFAPEGAPDPPPPDVVVFGPERRQIDRRRPGHERRFEASRGRRFRPGDRRRPRR